jgi:hypothetical protein
MTRRSSSSELGFTAVADEKGIGRAAAAARGRSRDAAPRDAVDARRRGREQVAARRAAAKRAMTRGGGGGEGFRVFGGGEGFGGKW